MFAASMPRACSWRFGASLFAEIRRRHKRRRWLPVARDESRWERVRHQIVADAPGPPAGALDFGHREVAEGAVLQPSRLTWLALTPISVWVDVETVCPKHNCRLDDYDLSNSSSCDLTSTLWAPHGSISRDS